LNNNNTTSSNNSIFSVIGYFNQLSTLNQSECPTKYSNLSSRTCLCETIFNTLEKLPRSLQIIWKQLKPVFIGKILYSPNTTIYNNLVKEINSTFQTIDEFTQILGQLDVVLDSLDQFKPLLSIIWELLPLNLTSQINYEDLFDNIDGLQQILLITKNLIRCFELNKFEGYEHEYQAVDDGMQMIETDSFWAALIFNDGKADAANSTSLPNKLKYKIRMSTSFTHNTFYTQDRSYRYGPNICTTCNIDFLYGYIYLQDMIERAIIESKTNSTQNFGITTQMSGYPCYVNDKFVNAITRTLPLFMVLAWIFTVSMLVKDIVYEKEKRLKEFMRVMGLSNGLHWTAWFITSFISMMIICIFLVIILKYGQILSFSDFSVLLVFFCCFTISTISQCFLISVFFNRANLAAAVGGIIYFLLYLPYTILVNYSDVLQPYQELLASLSSTVAFGYGCQLAATFELQSVGVNWDNFYKSPYTEGGLSMNVLCLVMLFDGFLYMLLTWYIENIAPGEFGIARPLYFPLMPSYWFGESYKNKFNNVFGKSGGNQKNRNKFLNGSNGVDNDVNLDAKEDLHDNNAKIGIEIKDLHKIYSRGNNHALKGLSINFYENEITSFLGHNGAGKSTVIYNLFIFFYIRKQSFYVTYNLERPSNLYPENRTNKSRSLRFLPKRDPDIRFMVLFSRFF
jgi:ATP-binding cassette subfamily A (ABC1) protein 1